MIMNFLPDAPKGWTQARYHDKLARIAKVIIATGEENVPDLVGLCEVENDHCLKDLTENSPLREAGYRYVMTDSPDERGIDVALLYQRGTFKLVGKNCISVPYKEIERRPTRDILHVTGQVAPEIHWMCLCVTCLLVQAVRRRVNPTAFLRRRY